MNRQYKITRFWLFYVAALLLIFSAAALWHTAHMEGKSSPDTQQSTADMMYSRAELLAEAKRVYMELAAQEIKVGGYTAKERYNAAVVVVDPDDAGKLQVTQKGVPDQRLFRLVRENEEVPVYIEFEHPPTALKRSPTTQK